MAFALALSRARSWRSRPTAGERRAVVRERSSAGSARTLRMDKMPLISGRSKNPASPTT
jgi:hypothetical protein